MATVSQAQFDKINKIDVGPKGDGKFVKKLAGLLWSRQELFNRSASGKACPNKDNSEARPACSPFKKTYIRGKYNNLLIAKHAIMESVCM